MSHDTADLAARIRRLEDIEAIRVLKAAYAHAADAKYTPDHRKRPQDEIDRWAQVQADLFTEDAVWDGRPQWEHSIGREAFYAVARTSVWTMATHHFVMPRIEVDGDAATGTWYLWQTGTIERTGEAMIMSAVTEDAYRREDGRWLIASTRLHLRYLAPIQAGWPEARNVPHDVGLDDA